MTLSPVPTIPNLAVAKKKIHGWVRDTGNKKIGGAIVRAFRGTSLYHIETTAKDGASAGKYEFELDDTGKCIDVIYFSHSSYHPSVVVPVCGIENNFINPVLYGIGEKIGGVVAMIQITNYDMILSEMARLRDPSEDISQKKRQELIDLVPILQKKIVSLSDSLTDDAMTQVYKSRLAKMQDFCQQFTHLSPEQLRSKLL